jgi:hypothetical protein
VAASLAWGVLADGYRPDRYDLMGAAICLLGAAVIRYAHSGNLAAVDRATCEPRAGGRALSRCSSSSAWSPSQWSLDWQGLTTAQIRR